MTSVYLTDEIQLAPFTRDAQILEAVLELATFTGSKRSLG